MLKRRILSLLMALVMVLSMTVSSYAEGSRQGTVPAEGETVSEETGAEAEPVDEEPAALEYHELHITYKNPLYGGAGKIVEEETEGVLETPEVFHSDGEETVYSVEDAAGVFREAMKERETTISFSLVVDHSVDREEVNALSDALTALALSHTGVPTEGDYLLYQYGGFEGRMGWSTDGGQSTVHYTYTVDYYTTKAQEDMVDAAVSELISSLNLSGADEYHKIRAVYDWMTHNIVYDKANLNNASYLLKYTAYAALINRTSVCQGYAVLLYRLLLTCGIDCRIISGLGDGNNGPEAHAWNIAQIGQYYFNLDATWDAPRAVNNLDFEYYLRADSTFTGHTRGTFNDNNDYTSAEFYAAYPMSAEDYSGLVAWNYDLTEYTVDPGDNVTLSVGASSDVGEVTFAWRRDGVMLDGEEGTTLQLYDIQENSSVTCIVSDGVSTVELDFFIYIRAIQSELTVYTEDSQFDLWYGDILNLYVDAWSNSEISYTWYKDGGFFAEGSNSVDVSEAGTYVCRVTDEYSGEEIVTFYVTGCSEIYGYLSQEVIYADYGSEVEFVFNLQYSTISDLQYQWYRIEYHDKDGVLNGETETILLEGENSDHLCIENAAEHGLYRLVVSDGHNSENYDCELIIENAFFIYTAPDVVTVPYGEDGTIGIGVQANLGPFSFRWYEYISTVAEVDGELVETGNWIRIPYDDYEIILPNVTDNHQLACYITDCYGNELHTEIMVTPDTGLYAKYEDNKNGQYYIPEGASITLRVIAGTNHPNGVIYEWYAEEEVQYYYDDEHPEEGSWTSWEYVKQAADGNELTLENVTQHTFAYCMVSDAISSYQMQFNVNIGEGVSELWIGNSGTNYYDIDIGQEAVFSVDAYSNCSITYTWYRNGELLSDETSDTLTTSEPGEYRCDVTDEYGGEESALFVVRVYTYIEGSINSSMGWELAYGGNTTISWDYIDSTIPLSDLSFQWYYGTITGGNGYTGYDYVFEPIPGENEISLQIENLTEMMVVRIDIFDGYNVSDYYCTLSVYHPFDVMLEDNWIFVGPGENAELKALIVNTGEGDEEEYSYCWYEWLTVTTGEEPDTSTDSRWVLIPDAVNSEFQVSSVMEKHNFLCEASDRFGNKRYAEATVGVDTGFSADYPDARRGEYYISEGDDVELSVIASTDLDTGLSFEWYIERDVEYLNDPEDPESGTYTVRETIPLESNTESVMFYNVDRDTDAYCFVTDGWNEQLLNFQIIIGDPVSHLSVDSPMDNVHYISCGDTAHLSPNVYYNCQTYYAWYRNGELIPGETSVTLMASLPGEYRCEVTDEYGGEGSASFTVYVDSYVDGYITADSGFEIPYGGDTTIRFECYDSTVPVSDLSFQWYRGTAVGGNGYSGYEFIYEPIPGEDGISLQVEGVTERTDFRLDIFDGYNTFQCWATVSVAHDFYVGLENDRVFVNPGESAVLKAYVVKAYAEDEEEYTYRWYELLPVTVGEEPNTATEDRWVLIPDAEDSEFLVSSVMARHYYLFEASDRFGNTRYIGATVGVDSGFQASYPDAKNGVYFVSEGDDQTLSIIASTQDEGGIHFEWYAQQDVEYPHDPDDPESGTYTSCEMVNLNSDTPSVTLENITRETEAYCIVSDAWNSERFDFRIRLGEPVSELWVSSSEYINYCTFGYNDEHVLTVYAYSNCEIYYAWYRDGELLPDETSNTLAVSEEGEYYCVVTDEYDDTGIEIRFTVSFQMDVNGWIIANGDSWDLNVEMNSSVEMEFYLDYSDVPEEALTYQWGLIQKDENGEEVFVPIEGADGKSYTVESVTEHRTYVLRVSEGYNYVYFTREVSILNDFWAYCDSETVTVPFGESATVTVTANAIKPGFTYQWYELTERTYEENGQNMSERRYVPIPGATSDTYTIDAVNTMVKLMCEVTDIYGNYSDVYVVVRPDTGFVAEYYNKYDDRQTVPLGETVTLAFRAETALETGLTFSWSITAIDVNGGFVNETSEETSIPQLSFAAVYRSYDVVCLVSDGVNSEELRFYIGTDELYAYGLPDDQPYKLQPGETVDLTVYASGVKEIHYAWFIHEYSEEKPIAEAEDSPVLTTGKTGNYLCRISSPDGQNYVVWFNVKVDSGFNMTSFGVSGNLGAEYGGNTTLTVVNYGSAYPYALSYEWFIPVYDDPGAAFTSRIPLEGGSTKNYTFKNVTENTEYGVMIRDEFNNWDWFTFTISVDNHLTLETDSYVSVRYEEDLTLKAKASAARGNIYYQWSKYDDNEYTYIPIAGATGAELLLENVTEKAQYLVEVTDDFENSIVMTVFVTIDNGLFINPLQDMEVESGTPLTLSYIIDAYDTEGMTIRWQIWHYNENGLLVLEYLSEDGPSLSIPSADEYAEYSIYVTDRYENQVSDTVVVSVKNDFSAVPSDGQYQRTAAPGETLVLGVNVSGLDTTGVTYAWSGIRTDDYSGVVIQNLHSAEISVKADFNAEYTCSIWDRFNNTATVTISVTVENHLTISSPVESIILVQPGDSVTIPITVTADQPGGMRYFWQGYYYSTEYGYTDSIVYDFKTTASLEDIQSTETLYVNVTDAFGNVVSLTWRIVVDNKLTAVMEETDIPVSAGDTVQLRVNISAADTEGMVCQWHAWDFNSSYPLESNTPVVEINDITESFNVSCNIYDRFGNNVYLTAKVYVDNGFSVEPVTPRYVKGIEGEPLDVRVAVHADDMEGLEYYWALFPIFEIYPDKDLENIHFHELSYTPGLVDGTIMYHANDRFGNMQELYFTIYVQDDIQTIHVDEIKQVDVGASWFLFTPEESGFYVIDRAGGKYVPNVMFFGSEDGTDDRGSYDTVRYFEAGQSYEIAVSTYSPTAFRILKSDTVIGGDINDHLRWEMNLETGRMSYYGTGPLERIYDVDSERWWNGNNRLVKELYIDSGITMLVNFDGYAYGPADTGNFLNVTDIYYGGTAEEWEDVRLLENTQSILTACKHFINSLVSFDANGGSGSMASVSIAQDESYTLPACGFTAPSGKKFEGWLVNGALKQPGDKITVTSNMTIKASWKAILRTVSFNANGGSGSMASVQVAQGESYKLPACGFTAPSGKEFEGWLVSGALKQPGGKITVTANITVKASWKAILRTVSFDANGGSGTMASVSVAQGESYTLPACGFTAPSGKGFEGWLVSDALKQPGDKITVTANVTVKASWKVLKTVPEITAVNKKAGIVISWEAVPDAVNYRLYRKGTKDTAFTLIRTTNASGLSYTDADTVFGDYYQYKATAKVGTKWSEDSNVVKIRRNHFTDVPDDASYFDKLVWAVNNGIISGSSATTFSPDNACTRYQFCVMLYKMMGRPDVDENATLPFTDVAENASYRKAVTWAYTNKIISGTSKTTFSPDAEVTRYQVVAVLYKLAGKPAIGDAENPFTDVKKSDSYYNAVMWAVQNKITGGTSKTTFSPKDTCKRYQMTVFLYKYYNLMN